MSGKTGADGEVLQAGEDADAISIDDLRDLMSELRGMASNLLEIESNAGSICATALVVSALRRYKLSDQNWDEITWANRSHFFKSSYMMMRRALIDHARRRQAEFRPVLESCEDSALDLYHLDNCVEHTPDRVIALDEALGWLSEVNHELSVIVQHHYFSRLTVKEIAKEIGACEKTVKRRLDKSRLVLEKKIRELMPIPT